MVKAWRTLDQLETAEGPIELRQRGDKDFLITVSGRVLMNSRASRSEEALAELACFPIRDRSRPRVVIGGLGMGCTLRRALDLLPPDASVVVCELNETIAHWCRGPLAPVSEAALDDPRTELVIGDVADQIRQLGDGTKQGAADAIVLDLYEGPHPQTHAAADPFYGSRALIRTRKALKPGGVFGIWSEDPDRGYESRLQRAGFADWSVHRPGRGGRRHAVYIAKAPLR